VSKPILTARSNFRVRRNRVIESEHATEREAIQEAICIKQCNPEADVSIDHDLEITVELAD